MDGRMFEGLVPALIVFGVIIGTVFMGLVWAFCSWGWPWIKVLIHQWTA